MSSAIITGASRGFGRAVALELARQGWNLVVDARTRADLTAIADELSQTGSGKTLALPGDVADPDHARNLVESATRLGDYTLLVNNASTLGPSPLPPLATYPLEELAQVMETNLIGPLRLIQLSLPELRRHGGTIVNITSDAAVEGYEGWGGYGSSKAALEQASNVLAVEEPKLRVYWFDPGDMQTRMHQEAFPGEDISDRPLPESRAPALIALLDADLPSGRYAAEQFLGVASR